jgi:hypothetical protein
MYVSPNTIRVIKSRGVHTVRMGMQRNAYKISVRKPEWKRSLGNAGCKREDKVKMDLIKVGSANGDVIHLVQYKALTTTAQKAGKSVAS